MDTALHALHNASMAILNKTGMVFKHPAVIKILSNHGIRVSGQKAFFTEPQILDAIATAPSTFTFQASNPEHNIVIGGDHVEFAAGYGAPKIIDENGIARNATTEDYIVFLKLIQASDLFHVNGGPLVQPSDIDTVMSLPLLAYLAILHSDKGLVVSNGNCEEMRVLFEMLHALYGETFEQNNALAITIINTLSPLQMDASALEVMVQFALKGQPVIVSPCAMAGTTGPMTLGGTIAMSNAEALAGIAAHQLISPGAPVVYGFQSTAADMKTGSIAIGSAERALCIAYGARLAKRYGLPCRGGGADNDASCADVQSGFESMMMMMTSCQEKMNFIIHSAGMLGGYGAMSVEKFIIDLEIIGMVKRKVSGVSFDDEDLALDVIDAVGPGGNFLTHPHTLKHCRQAVRTPLISQRGKLGNPKGQHSIYDRIKDSKKRLLEGFVRPEGSRGREKALNKILAAKGYPVGLKPILGN